MQWLDQSSAQVLAFAAGACRRTVVLVPRSVGQVSDELAGCRSGGSGAAEAHADALLGP
jgi:hypothetical protein